MTTRNISIIGAVIVSVSLVAGAAIGGRLVQAANAPGTVQEEAAKRIQDNLKTLRSPCKESFADCHARFVELEKDTAQAVQALGGPDGFTFGKNLADKLPSFQ